MRCPDCNSTNIHLERELREVKTVSGPKQHGGWSRVGIRLEQQIGNREIEESHTQDSDGRVTESHTQDSDGRVTESHTQDSDERVTESHTQDSDGRVTESHTQDSNERVTESHTQDDIRRERRFKCGKIEESYAQNSAGKVESYTQNSYVTIGICTDCGCTWIPAQMKRKPTILWLIVAMLWVVLVVFRMDADAYVPDSSSVSPTQNPTVTTQNTRESTPAVTENSIVINPEVLGEFGFETEHSLGGHWKWIQIGYRIPAGTYIAQTDGKSPGQLSVCSDETQSTAYGWEEPAERKATVYVSPGKSALLTIEPGYHLEVRLSGNLILTPQP